MTTNMVEFTIESIERNAQRAIDVQKAIIAGWTARDKDTMDRHIAALAEISVPAPPKTPIFYRVSAQRVTTAATVQMIGETSTGEVEFLVVKDQGRLFIGVGSDHTDRRVESYGITVAKQMCDKPVAATLWPYDEVTEHWDELILRSHIEKDGELVLYQEGSVAALLRPEELLDAYEADGGVIRNGTVMFCGTFTAQGGIQPTQYFVLELIDPVLQRSIKHAYDIEWLPLLG